MLDVDVVAVLVAAAAGLFGVGGLWYSKVGFGPLWTKENGTPKQRHPGAVFATAFACSLTTAWVLAAWMGRDPALGDAVLRCTVAGVAFVATSFGVNYAFAGRSPTLWAIDAGYHVAQFAAYGVVLGLLG